jgi:2-desacetyl-2-hydroxyethyl bacteriochlorophyllide A dehydrogenase
MTPNESTNRRIVVSAVEQMELREEPVPVPRDDEVLVRSTYIGVCGSDTHAFHGRHPFIPIPYLPGHEATGVVEELGADVTAMGVGDRVVVEPTLPCWRCKQCRNANENLCENLQFFGCGYPQGGMADRFVVRADRLHRIPDDISDLGAALIEPLSTPVHAGRLAGPLAGRAVAVLGAGTIGLLMLSVARWSGASRVVVTDPLAAKRDAALRLGADAVVDATAPDVAAQVRSALGESADVVFDCVAMRSTTLAAIDMALKGGTVVVVGVPSADFELPMRVIQDQQIRVQGSATYVPQDYATAMEMIQAGAVRAEDFITAEFPLEQAEQAFDASTSGEHIKVLIHP